MDTRRIVRAAAWTLGFAAVFWFFFGSIGPFQEAEVVGEPEPARDLPSDSTGDHATYGSQTPDSSFGEGIAAPASSAHAYQPGAKSMAVTPANRVTYAIGLHDLQGLPSHAQPGTPLQVWAAWDPPLVKEPRVQRLVDDVVLEKVIPPTLPEGPHVALLSIRPRDFPRLLYGDEWGRLSVVMLDSRT